MRRRGRDRERKGHSINRQAVIQSVFILYCMHLIVPGWIVYHEEEEEIE